MSPTPTLTLTATPTPTHPSGPAGVPTGPLARWLRDPSGAERRWWHEFTGALARQEPRAVLAIAAVAALVTVALVLREIAGRAAVRRGRWIEIRPPAAPSPAGGLALWRQLAPLLTTRQSFTGARPPVAFECLAVSGVMRAGLWVSRTLSPGVIAHVVETAWPGAHATLDTPPALLPVRGEGGRRASGAQVRLARPEWFPLGATHPGEASTATSITDPIRGLLATLAGVPAGGVGVLQVLARPATGRQLRRARRAALDLRRPPPTRGLRLPGIEPAHPARTAGPGDPLAAADTREIARKLSDPPHFTVAIRLGVAAGAGRAGRRARRGWLRQASAALGLYAGGNQLVLHSLHRPAAVLGSRRLRGGFLLSVGELAALAHLPGEPSRHGLPIAAARAVAAPAELDV